MVPPQAALVKYKGEGYHQMEQKEKWQISEENAVQSFPGSYDILNPVFTVGYQLEEAVLLHTDRTKKEAKERAIEMLTLVGVNEPEKRVNQYPS